MKTNAKLRPSWTFIAKKLQCSAGQCKARWSEILALQTAMDNETACHDTHTVAGSTLPEATITSTSPVADPALPAQSGGLSLPDTLVEAPYTRALLPRPLSWWIPRTLSSRRPLLLLLNPHCFRNFLLRPLKTHPILRLPVLWP